MSTDSIEMMMMRTVVKVERSKKIEYVDQPLMLVDYKQ